MCGQDKLFVLRFFQGRSKELVILLVTNTRKKYVGETWLGHCVVFIMHEDSANGICVVWSTVCGTFSL